MTTTPDTSKPPGQRSAEEVIERAAGTEGKYRCVAADTMGEFAAPSPEQIGRGVEAISGMLAGGGASCYYRAASYGYRGSHFTASERLALLETCGGACMARGEKDPTVDHIIPLSLGGMSVIENVQPLCSACNSE